MKLFSKSRFKVRCILTVVFIFFFISCHSNKSSAPLTKATDGAIKLAWEAGSDDRLSGYRIYFGTVSGQYDDVVDVGDTTTYTLSNLTAGQTYYISITAYDSSGNESSRAKEVVGKAK